MKTHYSALFECWKKALSPRLSAQLQRSPNRSELVCAPSAVEFSCAAAVGRSCFSDPPPSPSAALLRSLLVSLLMLLACPAASRLVRADLAAYVARVSGRVPSGPRPSPLACMGIAARPLRRLRPLRPFPPFQGLLCSLALLALSKAHLRVSLLTRHVYTFVYRHL